MSTEKDKVDISLLRTLRDTTGVALIDCKMALVESLGDFNKAIEILKIKGLAKAAQKSVNVATEGITKVLINGNQAIIAELNCQTDFVANNSEFNNLLNKILVPLLEAQPKTITEALNLKVANQETIAKVLALASAKLGENIILRRFQCFTKNDNEVFGSYVHGGGSHAGVVIMNNVDQKSDLPDNISMQLVAMNPKFIDVDQVDQSFLDKELQVIKEQLQDQKKPPAIIEKMIQGRMSKVLSELTIADQTYIKDSSITIRQYLKQNNATIKVMMRYQVGESINQTTN